MTTILIDLNNYDEDLEYIKKKYPKVKIINTTFVSMKESYPVVLRYPEGSFYGHVSIDRVSDVIGGYADDLKIQTARFFNVEMKKYISEEKYRLIVIEFFDYLDQISPLVSDNISKGITTFSEKFNFIELEVIDTLKMALIKTTKGPLLSDLIEALGKVETENRLNIYLNKYKYRI
jgi:(2Fe-2S) ferredoxin